MRNGACRYPHLTAAQRCPSLRHPKPAHAIVPILIRFLPLVFLLAAACGGSTKSPDSAEVVPDLSLSDLRGVLSGYDAAYMTDSRSLVADLWARGARLTSGNGEEVQGPRRIAGWYLDNVTDSRLGLTAVDTIEAVPGGYRIPLDGGLATISVVPADTPSGWAISELSWSEGFGGIVIE